MTSVLAQEPWKYDSKVVPIPWRQTEEDSIKARIASKGLNIGFYKSDGNVSFVQAITVGTDNKGASPSTNTSRYRHCCLSYQSRRAYSLSLDTIQTRLRTRPYQFHLFIRWRH